MTRLVLFLSLVAVAAATPLTSSVYCTIEVGPDVESISATHQTACDLVQSEAAHARSSIEGGVSTGTLLARTVVESYFYREPGKEVYRSGEAGAMAEFSQVYGTTGPPRMGIIKYELAALALGGDQNGQADAYLRFGSMVFEGRSSSGVDVPRGRQEAEYDGVPFQLGQNFTVEARVNTHAKTFYQNEADRSFYEQGFADVYYWFELYEADGVTAVLPVLGGLPDPGPAPIPEPGTAQPQLGSLLLLRAERSTGLRNATEHAANRLGREWN
jgi:hypothetical protein